MLKNSKVRVRIAPSPTGPLHLGTARSALYNYLFAKKHNGVFILRIEDTDLERSQEKYTAEILESLLWLGIEWDEGPRLKGPQKGNFSPYRQSQRTDIYQKYIQRLIQDNKVYQCYCTPDELEEERRIAARSGQAPKYSGKCRNLTEEERRKLEAEGRNSIIRLKVTPKLISFDDGIRGKVTFDCGLLGDISVARDEKTPLYNLAVVIDDYTMGITHVIRGEDHISNTPKQILLQEALGLSPPHYAHLPLILNQDRSKLSKRKSRVSVIDYKKEGYLPEALLNFLALLGWNPKTEEEIFSKEELIKKFSLENVHKGGAVFSQERLDWINGYYIRKLKQEDFFELALPFLEKANLPVDHREYIKKAIALEQQRIKKLSELPAIVRFFFEEDLKYEPQLLIWKETPKDKIIENLKRAGEFFEALSEADFTKEKIEQDLKKIIKEEKIDTGAILWPLRVALTGREASPGPFEVAAVLRKTRVLARIKKAIISLH